MAALCLNELFCIGIVTGLSCILGDIMTYFALFNPTISEHLLTFGLIAVYSVIGVLIMLGCALLSNHVFRLNIRKEILEEHNTAFGIMVAGLFIAIAIIVAASVVS